MTNRPTLILDNKPQTHLFNALSKRFSRDNRVGEVIQRGSFAKNESDRASDVDILLVVDDDSVDTILKDLDETIRSICTVLTHQGWVDTIVPDFGGIGFVYLVKFENRLVQLDIYITPASWSQRIHDLKDKVILHKRTGFVPTFSKKLESKEVIDRHLKTLDRDFQIAFEFLLLYFMLTKHIYRSRATLAVKYRYALTESLAVFLRLNFAPQKIDYKMYDWHGDFKDVLSPSVRKFERLIVHSDAYSISEIHELLNIFKTVLFENSQKDLYKNFAPLIQEIESYTTCLLSADYE